MHEERVQIMERKNHMSGPKCDEIVLSLEEETDIRESYEERLRLERERIRQRRRQEYEERKRLKEERKNQVRSYNAGVEEQLRALREAEEEAYQEEFEEALAAYEAAAALAGVEPRPYSFKSGQGERLVRELCEETEALKSQTVAKACQERVEGWIDRTIEEMGYHVIGQRETNGAFRAISRLYQYDENTALHVIGVDGQFTMEIVAVDQVDREPTKAEADRLTGSMERFCADYQQIRERLEESGSLEVKQVFHMPVDKRYAAVVNQSAYQETGKTEEQRRHTAAVVRRGADYMETQASKTDAVRRSR